MSPSDKGSQFFMNDAEIDPSLLQQQLGESCVSQDGIGQEAFSSSMETGTPSSTLVNENPNGRGMDAYARQMRQFATSGNGDGDEPTPRPSDVSATASVDEKGKSSMAAPSKGNNESQPISSVDARVLESILQDGKLDLSTEEEVKKLLEGPRLQEGRVTNDAEKEDGKYSSKFVSTVSDNSFWNSLRAKANEIIDSVGIYIENRIERDSKTLAAVGLFTLDRIRRDIGRALPAAGRATRQFLLATNSSYAEKLLDATDNTPFALPSERSLTEREMYEDLSTPADEIRQVTEAIRDILSGKDVPSDTSPNARRGVRSFAPAGTSRLAERQRRAYRARKETVLKREAEGTAKQLGRALGSVSDATWEIRREMQTGVGREAGYRSKGVRKALTSGAVKLLEASRERSKRLLGGKKERRIIKGDTGSPEVVDVSPIEEEDIIQDIIEEANMEYAPDGLLSPQGFIEEKRRLISSLESCLSQPSETWLTKEVVSPANKMGVSLDGAVLRQVITSMVTFRDDLENEMKFVNQEIQFDYLKMEYVQSQLRGMKQMVNSISSLAVSAAGEAAALLLKQELEGFVLSDSLDDIIEIELERMEQLLAEKVATREEEMMKARRRDQQRYWNEAAIVKPEIFTETATEAFNSARSAATEEMNGGIVTEVEVVSFSTSGEEGREQMPYVTSAVSGGSGVEVLSNNEYENYISARGVIDTTGRAEYELEDINGSDENPAADFILRVVDVVFFIGEKFFFVLLPDLISGGEKVTARYSQAINRGKGSVGWKMLKNPKTKNIR